MPWWFIYTTYNLNVFFFFLLGCPSNENQLGKGLVILRTHHGGHVAFPESNLFNCTHSYMDTVIVEWIKVVLFLNKEK